MGDEVDVGEWAPWVVGAYLQWWCEVPGGARVHGAMLVIGIRQVSGGIHKRCGDFLAASGNGSR